MDGGDVIAERYQLESQIGEGGMAAVWRATDTRLDRPVALKFLFMRGRDAAGQREATEAFRREAKIAAAIRHRNVVEVLDFGVTDDAIPFMAMEVLEGASLGEMLDGGHVFTVSEIIRIIGLTLQGLIAVHASGIVHRDLKPENIFLLRDRDTYYPKLVDFGISKSLDPSEGRASAIKTKEGLFVGTPMYMSSEQARGITDIDVRTDVYSLGVILYELLGGRLPYDTEHVGDLLVRIMQGGAPPLMDVAPEIGPHLSDLVARAMHVDREMRFPSAEAMYDALMGAAERVGDATGSLSLRPPAMGAFRTANTADADQTVDSPVATPSPTPSPAPGAEQAVAAPVEPAGAPSSATAATPAGGGRAGWVVAAIALLVAGAGVGYGVLSARGPATSDQSRYIVVETPSNTTGTAVAGAGVGSEPLTTAAEPGQAGQAPTNDGAQPADTEDTAAAPEPGRAAQTPTDDGAQPAPDVRSPRKRKHAAGAAGLSQAFAEQQGKIAPCFDGKLDAARKLPKLAIRFSIDRRGKVLSTRLSPADFRSSPLGSCIEKRARAIRFDPQPGPIAFNIPLQARVGG